MHRITLLLALAAAFSPLFFSCSDPEPVEPEKTKVITLTAALDNVTSSCSKSCWSTDDEICVYGFSGGQLTKETVSPWKVSSDGLQATLTTVGSVTSDDGVYYAFLKGSGVEDFGGDGWKVVLSSSDGLTNSMDALVGRTAGGSMTLSFKNILSHIKVSVTKMDVAYVVLEGNEGEYVGSGCLVSKEDMSVVSSGSSSSGSSTSLKIKMSGVGTCEFGLIPGITFSSGYTVSAYDESGNLLGSIKTTESFTTSVGEQYKAPALEYVGGAKSSEFDPTRIVSSMAMISDVHIDHTTTMPTEKFRKALNFLETKARKDDPNGIAAVLVDGDLTQYPYSSTNYYSEVDIFKETYESVFDPLKVPMIYTIGNHDTYKWWTSDVYTQAQNISERLGSNYFLADLDNTARGQWECRHCRVGACNILCVTPWSLSPVTYPSYVTQWLEEKLGAITEDNPEQYVIVMTHPMIHNTVYGSDLGTYWYTDGLSSILSRYPQVIVFGGHLHFPINDPRSIWQGAFTSVGCGSVRYMAIESGGYEDMQSSTVMKDCNEVSSGHLLQIDESGNIRITRMFFSQSETFGEPWTLPYPRADRSHLRKYDTYSRQSSNTAPHLSSVDAEVTPVSASSSLVTVTFPSGSDDEFVHHYVVTLKKDGEEVSTKKILADFYKHSLPSKMKSSWSLDMGNFQAGDYQVSLTAYDSWDSKSNEVTKSFTVTGEAPSPASVYADLDFGDGKVTDSKGKLTITNNGATIGKTSLSSCSGKSVQLDAVTIKSSQSVSCKFNEITSSDAMKTFMAKGFSVEAFYIDRSPESDKAHGIACGTEYGGWGLATGSGSYKGFPYFVIGHGSSNSYSYAYSKSAASSTDLVHVVGVYDAASQVIRLYVNGVLQNYESASGPYFPATGSDFNAFCLGSDVGASAFPATDMVIVDVKLYTGALTASQVSAAYSNATDKL